MILKIYFLCHLCLVVSSYPVTSTIPYQEYPYTNEYRISSYNPTNDFNPCLLQNTVQNAPLFVNQQNDYRIPPLNPANEFNPYLLQNTVKNPSPLDLKQVLLNQILSKPSLQAILDHNAAGYGLNEVATPSVVNNYIILPMDCPNVNKTDISKDISLKTETKKDKKSSKKDANKKSKRKPHNEPDKAVIERDKNIPKSDKDIPTKPKPLSPKRKEQNDTINNGNERNSNRDGKKRKQRQNETTGFKDSLTNNITEFNTEQMPKRRRKKADIDVNNTLTNQNVSEQADTTPTKGTMVDNTKKPATTPDTENKATKTATNEFTNDFLKTFPNIPEDTAKSFMAGMNQFNNPQLTSFFANYEQFYQSFMTGSQDVSKRIRKRRKPKKNKRNRRRHQKNKARNDNNATNNKTLINSNNIDMQPNRSSNIDPASNSMRFKVSLNPVTVTADKTKYVNVETQPYAPEIVNLHSNQIFEVPKSIDIPPYEENIVVIDTVEQSDEGDATEDVNNDEFDTPSIYYELIDDYYPLFIDNAAYANEMIVGIDNERLVYTDDGIEDTDYEYKRNVNDRERYIDSTNDKRDKDEIEFRQPPLLEVPDFVTRKVERNEIKPNRFDDIDSNDLVRNYNDKYSSYSNAKSSNNEGKQSKGKLSNDVETVYARSKVVKYGQVEISDEDADTPVVWETYQGDGTTYVIAKSLDPGEFW